MSSSLPVHLIRQWNFCPRIVYYIELCDYPVQYPSWLRQGEVFHEEQLRLWQRRNLSRFNLETGKIHLNCQGESTLYHIHGIADMLIETPDLVVPVEFKLGRSNSIFQLVAYGMIMEELFQKKCRFGFLAEGRNQLMRIEIGQGERAQTVKIITEIQKMIESGIKPDSSASLAQCTNCEYLNRCNDRG